MALETVTLIYGIQYPQSENKFNSNKSHQSFNIADLGRLSGGLLGRYCEAYAFWWIFLSSIRDVIRPMIVFLLFI
jgi:hypothetical protein